MKKYLFFFTCILFAALLAGSRTHAQQYKLRQSTGMMGMNSESIIYVKGMRKRTESKGFAGMSPQVTIEQCDLQRTVQLNDRKKLYYIERFSQEETIPASEENDRPVRQQNNVKQGGGTIHMWYSITDTGERKKMYGFTARHIWTSRKMKPTPDACSMKDSIWIKTDGWYIDLPQFNCPEHFRPMRTSGGRADVNCVDRYVLHQTGKGRLGFPLTETTTIIMGNAREMRTTVETIELSTAPLDSLLFEIPPGYTLAQSPEELQDRMDASENMRESAKNNAEEAVEASAIGEKKAGVIRIGVFAPTGSDDIEPALVQRHLASTLTGNSVEAIPIANQEEAQKYHCDYTMGSVITSVKPVVKAGNLLKAITKADLNASSFTVGATVRLRKASDNTVVSEQSVDDKYDGRINEATGKALDEGGRMLLKVLR